jgi:preprotein translocase subunit YajC
MNDLWILAQAAGSGGVASTNVTDDTSSTTSVPGGNPQAPAGQKPQVSPWSSYMLLAVMMVFIFVMMFRTPQKQKQERKRLEQSLEKNDKVITIGGIIGTIVDIKDEEVTLKVDESNNTKIKIQKRAIGRNISKEKA